MRFIINIGAIACVIAGLLILAFFGSTPPVLAQDDCLTVEDHLAAMDAFLESKGMTGVTSVIVEPETGDTVVVTVSPQKPTSLHLRFVSGCFVEAWEELLPPAPTPA
jgi:hypothetical protein